MLPRRHKKVSGFCLLPHYKWCGPRRSGPGEPINDLDAACKIHDECYRKFGPCGNCDIEFIRLLKSKINLYTKKGRHALLIYFYMKVQYLFTCKRTKRKF